MAGVVVGAAVAVGAGVLAAAVAVGAAVVRWMSNVPLRVVVVHSASR